MTVADELIKIEPNSNEALVLFEFLSRYSDTQQLVIEDQAEQRVLWEYVLRSGKGAR